MSLNVCIIGAGGMGTYHARAWAARDDAKVVAIADGQLARAGVLAGEFKAVAFDDYRRAIEMESVHVVSICTPTFMHSEIACFAAERGRHILTEKPLALTLDQGQAMIDAARRNKVKLAVSFQNRDGWAGRCARMVQNSEFPGPVILRYSDVREVRPKIAMHRRDMNGGPVIDMACHYFDLLRFITCSEPRRVFARGFTFGKGKPHLREVNDPAIDAATINVEYDGGHLLDFTVNWGMPEGFPAISDCYLMGPAMLAHPQEDRLMIQHSDHQALWPIDKLGYPPERRIGDLVRAIQDNKAPRSSGEDGLIALRTSMAALESIRTAQSVEIQ